MNIDFTYNKEEMVDSRRRYLFMSKTITRMQLVVTVLLVILEILVLVINGITTFSALLGILLILYIVLMSVLYFYFPILIYKKTDKSHLKNNLEFLSDKILFQTSNIKSELAWNNYSMLWESKDYFYLIQSKDMYTLLPKRVFASIEQQEQLIELYKKGNTSGNHKRFK